jgi:hypothetical protein
LNTHLFQNKKILEIGAGNALCGVTIAPFVSHITISDFNEVVLNNIESIVDLNSGDYQMTSSGGGTNAGSCLGNRTSGIEVCRLDWNKLLPASCTPSDASSTFQSSDDVITSKYPELTDPRTPADDPGGGDSGAAHTAGRTFDVIIASDIVCCESDAVGVAHTLRHFLKKEANCGQVNPCPVAIFVVPTEFHR